jgi:tol-pal system protein YbgF
MSTDSPGVRARALRLLSLTLLGGVLAMVGCGPSEEATDEDWETLPTVSPAAQMEFRVDSLSNENRRMNDQVEALAAENRSLRARIAELETRLTETMTKKPETAPTPVPVVASGDTRTAYSAALDQFMSRNYGAATAQFEALLAGGVGADLVDNCHYWIGESQYALGNYSEAIRQFETVLTFPQSAKKPYAQLMIGNSYSALGNTTAARDAYNAVINTYPTSSLVTKAQEKLARLR